MTTVAPRVPGTLADLPYADLEGQEYATAPYDYLDRMREQTWGARTAIGLMVLGYDAIQEVYNDPRFRTPGVDSFKLQGVTSGLAYEWWESTVLNKEGPDHLRIRSLVRNAFSPKSVDRYRERMRVQVRELAAALPVGEPFDFVELYANPLPVGVTCSLLGVEAPDFEQFREWTSVITRMTQPVAWADSLPKVEAALAGMFSHLDAMMAQRRLQLRDDLLSDLLRAEEGGDRLTSAELRSLVSLLLVGGMDTTRFQLGSMMEIFLNRPGQWEALAADPDLAGLVAEELLRYRPAIMENFRFACTDVELRGVLIPAGTYISMSTAAANHDEEFTARGCQFDMRRPPTRHVTFGKGAHYCLGAALARTEVEETLRTLPALMTDLTWHGEPTHRLPRAITGPETIPMSFTRRQ
jgi:cytochrome P450